MAALVRVASRFYRPLLASASKTSQHSNSVRAYAAWNKDWKPGPYPVTPEERAAAAKKYGLRVEDYEPYPDDGFGHGDYPKLPPVSGASRSEYDEWDIPELKRNYGEPMHIHSDAMQEAYYDANKVYTVPLWKMYIYLSGTVGAFIFVYWLLWDIPHRMPAMPKQFPEEGVTHYTFEKPE